MNNIKEVANILTGLGVETDLQDDINDIVKSISGAHQDFINAFNDLPNLMWGIGNLLNNIETRIHDDAEAFFDENIKTSGQFLEDLMAEFIKDFGDLDADTQKLLRESVNNYIHFYTQALTDIRTMRTKMTKEAIAGADELADIWRIFIDATPEGFIGGIGELNFAEIVEDALEKVKDLER